MAFVGRVQVGRGIQRAYETVKTMHHMLNTALLKESSWRTAIR